MTGFSFRYNITRESRQMQLLESPSVCVYEGMAGWQMEKGGSGSYLGGLVEPGAQRKILLLCVLTPDVSMWHFILLSFLSSRLSAGAKIPQKKRLRQL